MMPAPPSFLRLHDRERERGQFPRSFLPHLSADRLYNHHSPIDGETATLAPTTAANHHSLIIFSPYTSRDPTASVHRCCPRNQPRSPCCAILAHTRCWPLAVRVAGDRRRRCQRNTQALLRLHAKVIKKRRIILSCSYGAPMVIVAPYNIYIF